LNLHLIKMKYILGNLKCKPHYLHGLNKLIVKPSIDKQTNIFNLTIIGLTDLMKVRAVVNKDYIN